MTTSPGAESRTIVRAEHHSVELGGTAISPYDSVRAPHAPAVSGRTRPSLDVVTSLALLIVAGEWSGLARAMLGGQPVFAAVLDGALVCLTAGAAFLAIHRKTWVRPPLIGLLVASYVLLAAVEILNPNVPSLVAGLEGFRKTAFTALAFFVVILARSDNPRRFFQVVALGSVPALLWAARQSAAPIGIELDLIATSGVSPITFHSGSALRAFAPTSGPFLLGLLAAAVLVIAVVFSMHGSRWWIAVALLGAWDVGASITRANMTATVVVLAVIATIYAVRWGRPRAAAIAALASAVLVTSALVALGVLNVPKVVLLGAIALSGLAFAYAAWRLPPVRHGLARGIRTGIGWTGGGRYLLPFVPVLLVGLVLVGEVVGHRSSPTAAPTDAAAVASPSAPQIEDLAMGIANVLQDKNLQLRFGYWREQIGAIARKPLVGYGTSSAADGFGKYYQGTDSALFQPHSLYFKPALELGLGGAILFIGVLALILREAWRLLSSWPGVGLTGLGIVALVAISGITGPMLDAHPLNLLFWATCGWIVSASMPRTSARSDALPSAA